MDAGYQILVLHDEVIIRAAIAAHSEMYNQLHYNALVLLE